MRRDAVSYVVKDFSVGYFGDFIHTMHVKFTAADDTGLGMFWGLSKNNNYTWGDKDTNNDGISLIFYRDGVSYKIYFYNDETGASINLSITQGRDYYIRVRRKITEGTCEIYNDPGMTDIHDILYLTLPTTKYQYIVAVGSREAAPVSAPAITYTIEDMNINKPPALTFGSKRSLYRNIGGV